MHERAVEPVAQVGAAGAGAERVVGAEHDVVREQLRAPVEELGERLLAVLGVELVLLLDRDPGESEPLALDLLVSLRLLGLELGELVPGRLPFLTGSNLVFRHLISLQSDSGFPVRADSIVGSDATGIRKLDRRRPRNSSQPSSNSDEFSSSGRSRGGEHRKDARMTEPLIARLDELARKPQAPLL